jgi:hypothetical protein
MLFNDRRNTGHLPTEEDYQTPMSPPALAKANKRFRQSGVSRTVGTDPDEAQSRIKSATKMRRKGELNPQSVGEYLEFLNGVQSGV